MCTWSWNSNSDDLLKFCDLPSLLHRRHLWKLSFLHQVLHGRFAFPGTPVKRHSVPFALRNAGPSKLLRPPARTNAYQCAFFPHTIALWNSLPSSLHSCSLLSFKRAISWLTNKENIHNIQVNRQEIKYCTALFLVCSLVYYIYVFLLVSLGTRHISTKCYYCIRALCKIIINPKWV